MQSAEKELFHFEGYTLDLTRGCIRNASGEIELRPKSFELLRYLVENAGRLIAKDELINAVWPNVIVSDDSLAQCVSDLRHALNDPDRRIIKTVPRRGYLFAAPVSMSPDGIATPLPKMALPLPDDLSVVVLPFENPTGDPSRHEQTMTSTRRLAAILAADVMGNSRLSGADEVGRNKSTIALVAFDRPSIVVLPFTNINRDPEQDYFVDGITEEIITALARIRWFFVIACHSTVADEAKSADVEQFGRELAGRYVLKGSVRKDGQRVRIGAQLIDAASGAHFWADNFDGLMKDVFALQHEIAVSVAGIIEPALQAAEIRRAIDRRTTDLTAYDLYLRALALFASRQKASIMKATNLLKQAIQCDPHYGPALALAASCHVYFHAGGWTSDPEANCREGRDLALQALQVAGEDPGVLARAAYVCGYFGEDIDSAIVLVERSLELNPSFSQGWHFSGWLRLWAGQPERAIEDFKTHQRLRGLKLTNHPGIGVAYFFSSRFEEARKALLVSLHDYPSWAPTYRFLAACCARMGRLDEAGEIVERLRALTPVVVPSATNWRDPVQRELLLTGLRLACMQTPPS